MQNCPRCNSEIGRVSDLTLNCYYALYECEICGLQSESFDVDADDSFESTRAAAECKWDEVCEKYQKKSDRQLIHELFHRIAELEERLERASISF